MDNHYDCIHHHMWYRIFQGNILYHFQKHHRNYHYELGRTRLSNVHRIDLHWG